MVHRDDGGPFSFDCSEFPPKKKINGNLMTTMQQGRGEIGQISWSEFYQ